MLGVSIEVDDLGAAERIVGRGYPEGARRYAGPFGDALLAPTQPDLGLFVEFHRSRE